MAFTDLNDQVAFGSASSASTITFSTTSLSDVVAGDLLVLFWGSSAVSMTVLSIADNGGGGQTWNTSTAPKSGLSASHGFAYCKAISSNFGTTITVTLNTVATQRVGTLMAFHAANANPVLEIIGGAQSDNASPVDTTFTGTLPYSDCLGIVGYGWHTTTASASGLAWTEPTGFTAATTFGDSGATSNRFGAFVEFKDNIGSTTSIRGNATFTVLTGCHSWILIFSDVAPPAGNWVPGALSRPSPYYKSPQASTKGGMGPSPLQSWTPGVLSRASPYYRSPAASTRGFGPSPPQDWAPGVTNRPLPAYRGALPMGVVIPTPIADQDEWTPSVLSRRSPAYAGPRGATMLVTDTPAATTPDVFVAPVGSRAVANYRGSYSFNASAADELIGLWADFKASRQTLPRADRSGVFGVYDNPTVTAADTWASAIYSQLRLPLPTPRSLTNPPLVADQDEWTTVVYSQLRLPTPAPRSLARPPLVADQDEWTLDVLSRRSSLYAGPRGSTILVTDTPAVAADVFVAPVGSRIVAYYRGSYSLNASAADEAIGLWASFNRSRQGPGPAGRSSTFAAYDNPAAAATDTWARVAMSLVSARLLRSATSFTVGAGDEAIDVFVAAPVTSRAVAYYCSPRPSVLAAGDEPTADFWAQVTQAAWRAILPPGRSAAINTYFTAAAVAADTWAQVFQSATLMAPPRSRRGAILAAVADNDVWAQVFKNITGARSARFASSATSAYVDEVVAADTWAQGVQSLRRARVDPSQSRFVSTLGLDTPGSFVALIQSRQSANYAAPRALFVPVLFSPPFEFPPGGGGFGAEASAAWLRRYHAAYEGRYRGGYKSTLRKAK